MKNKLSSVYLLFILSLVIYQGRDVNTEVSGNYESADVICEKCNCTDSNEVDEKDAVFTVDCSMKNVHYFISEWPEYVHEKFKEIVYVMSFNAIGTVPPFASTDTAIFYTCKNCKIFEISENAFIDARNIISLDLSHNELKSSSLNPDIFRGPHSDDDYSPINLQMLDLSHNHINFLDERLFEHVPYLKKLIFSFNDLEKLEDGTLKALASCQHLEILHLEHVGISELPAELFENMKYLAEINLNENHLTEVPASLSIIGYSLEVLYLNSNPIEAINAESFLKLEKLEKLSLQTMSELKLIEKGSMQHLKSLEMLECNGNKKLSSMSLNDLLQLDNLKELDISKNQLQVLDFGDVVDIEKLENETEKKEYFRSLHTLKLAGNPWNCDCKIIKALDFFNHNSTYFKKAEKFDEARCASPNDLLSKLLYILPFDYICAADHKSKPLKIPVYEPPQFLRPKSIMLTIGSVVLVVVLGIIIGILIVCISRRLKSNSNIDNSNPIRYSAVRNSTVSNAVSYQR